MRNVFPQQNILLLIKNKNRAKIKKDPKQSGFLWHSQKVIDNNFSFYTLINK